LVARFGRRRSINRCSGAHPGKLAQYDVNGDGIICPAPVKTDAKHVKPSYRDNTPI
jgi:hypothetical protein